MRENIKAGSHLRGRGRSPTSVDDAVQVMGHWQLRAFDPDGNLIHEDEWDNLVVDEGLNELLIQALTGGTQTATWYIGLTDGAPTAAAGDTMSSHAGWTEQQGYDEAVRQTWTPGAVSGKSVDNSGSVATFTITSDGTTIGGGFLTSDSTKGGTTGKLYSIGAFAGSDVTLSANSTLQVTATFTTQAAP